MLVIFRPVSLPRKSIASSRCCLLLHLAVRSMAAQRLILIARVYRFARERRMPNESHEKTRTRDRLERTASRLVTTQFRAETRLAQASESILSGMPDSGGQMQVRARFPFGEVRATHRIPRLHEEATIKPERVEIQELLDMIADERMIEYAAPCSVQGRMRIHMVILARDALRQRMRPCLRRYEAFGSCGRH